MVSNLEGWRQLVESEVCGMYLYYVTCIVRLVVVETRWYVRPSIQGRPQWNVLNNEACYAVLFRLCPFLCLEDLS